MHAGKPVPKAAEPPRALNSAYAAASPRVPGRPDDTSPEHQAMSAAGAWYTGAGSGLGAVVGW